LDYNKNPTRSIPIKPRAKSTLQKNSKKAPVVQAFVKRGTNVTQTVYFAAIVVVYMFC
jgi:hypothetical protein